MSEETKYKTGELVPLSNDHIWQQLRRPPQSALKTIQAGRLRNFTDVNPQWRYQAMTEQFGPCGTGWKYEIVKVWTEQAGEQALSFAQINLYVRDSGAWSDPIPGLGGSSMIAKEKSGLHVSDECYKMAITDALSVAMKMLGVAADIYAGLWDGSKYKDAAPETKSLTESQAADLRALMQEVEADEGKFLCYFKIGAIENLPAGQFSQAVKLLQAKRGK